MYCIVAECADGCDRCLMSGKDKCDGPRCDVGYYINSNNKCESMFSSTLKLIC